MSRRQANSDVYQAVADPTRRAILEILREDPLTVGALASHFDVTMSAVSQHMRILREAELVEVKKQGRERVYRLAAEPLRDIHAWTAKYQAFWGAKIDALSQYLDTEREEGSDGRES
jgi:DNA-binding transcriptional ArsR family regulator